MSILVSFVIKVSPPSSEMASDFEKLFFLLDVKQDTGLIDKVVYDENGKPYSVLTFAKLFLLLILLVELVPGIFNRDESSLLVVYMDVILGLLLLTLYRGRLE